MAAAAKHLTPVTLELGGKSPVIVDDTCDIRVATRRIVWGKYINAGQSCIAPDYIIFTSKKTEKEFAKHFAEQVKEMFGEDPQTSDCFGRIITRRHFDRIFNLLNTKGEITHGGRADANDL